MERTEKLTILSFSSDREKASRRAEILKQNGFEVRSVSSPVQAQFEIEMGQCDIFVTCPVVSKLVTLDLVKIFRRYCPDGIVVFIKSEGWGLIEAEIVLEESNDPTDLAEAITVYLRRQEKIADSGRSEFRFEP